MRLVKGSALTATQREAALSIFVGRWTRENPHRARFYGTCPTCGVRGGSAPGAPGCEQTHPTIPLMSDAEWIAAHAFRVTESGVLSRRHFAEPHYLAEK